MMCLAVAGKIVELDGENAIVDVRGNRVEAITAMVPDVKVEDYVLLHAGFAIAIIDEQEYLQHKRTMEELANYAQDLFQPE